MFIMKAYHRNLCVRSVVWFFAGFCLVNLVGASIVGDQIITDGMNTYMHYDVQATETLKELNHLGLLQHSTQPAVEDLLEYQRKSGKSIAQILKNPVWCHRLGLSSVTFKATWYVANPFELLPKDLQRAIKQRKTPFTTKNHVWQWCCVHNVPEIWRKALDAALIETTPYNLWRASRGQRPYTKNGQYLEPIVVDYGRGHFDVRDGHIATDPSVIPTNTEMLLVMRIKGEDRILRVKAADVGEAVKGRHVDLPIQVSRESRTMPYTLLPAKYIQNPYVRILMVGRPNRGRKV